MRRYFTVAEANALLPVLRPHVARLVTNWRRLNAVQEEVIALLAQSPHNDMGGGVLSIAADALIRAQDSMFVIQTLGADIKDITTGLLDFPALRDNVEICLCWRYDEPRVEFWHSTETGFAGRQPLNEE